MKKLDEKVEDLLRDIMEYIEPVVEKEKSDPNWIQHRQSDAGRRLTPVTELCQRIRAHLGDNDYKIGDRVYISSLARNATITGKTVDVASDTSLYDVEFFVDWGLFKGSGLRKEDIRLA